MTCLWGPPKVSNDPCVQRIEDVLGYIILEIQKKNFVKLCEKITEEKAVLPVNGTLHVKKSETSPTLGA